MLTIESRMKRMGEEIKWKGSNDIFMIIISLSDVAMTCDDGFVLRNFK